MRCRVENHQGSARLHIIIGDVTHALTVRQARELIEALEQGVEEVNSAELQESAAIFNLREAHRVAIRERDQARARLAGLSQVWDEGFTACEDAIGVQVCFEVPNPYKEGEG